jgi:hypothetical protein
MYDDGDEREPMVSQIVWLSNLGVSPLQEP